MVFRHPTTSQSSSCDAFTHRIAGRASLTGLVSPAINPSIIARPRWLFSLNNLSDPAVHSSVTIERKCFGDLLREPNLRRAWGDREMDDSPSIVIKYNHGMMESTITA
jgi:hypothetical protein